MASRSYDRVDFYRRNRDYSRLLEGDGPLEEEYVEEADNNSRKYRKSAPDEDPQATRERQEFIQRRQKLKELERVKLKQKFTGVYGRKTDLTKHENGNQNSRFAGNISENDKKRKLPYDNYGSFFGPSQPVISRRVIEETRSRVENAHVTAKVEKARVAARVEKAHVAAKVSKEAPEPKKSSTSSTKIKIEYKKKPVVVNEAIKKAQQLKAARDYSFLLSEDAEIPTSERGQTSQNRNVASTRPSNGQLKPLIAKSSTAVKKPTLSSKPVSHAKEVKSIASSSRQMPAKVDSQKVSVNSKKLLTKIVSGSQSVRDNVSIRQNGSNAKMPVNACADKKRLPATSGSKVIKAEHQRSLLKAEQQSSVMHRTSVQKAPPLKTPTQRPHTEQRKPVKSVPSKPITKPLPKPAPTPKVVPKPAPTPAPKAVPKPTSKPVPKMAPKSQSRPTTRDLHHEHLNKRPRVYDSDEDLDEGTNFRSLIRQMFRYDPSKYKDIDEDDSDMEVGFSRIQAEERRSARIAREEDERELALIEAEEMEERAKAKKRKLKQGQR